MRRTSDPQPASHMLAPPPNQQGPSNQHPSVLITSADSERKSSLTVMSALLRTCTDNPNLTDAIKRTLGTDMSPDSQFAMTVINSRLPAIACLSSALILASTSSVALLVADIFSAFPGPIEKGGALATLLHPSVFRSSATSRFGPQRTLADVEQDMQCITHIGHAAVQLNESDNFVTRLLTPILQNVTRFRYPLPPQRQSSRRATSPRFRQIQSLPVLGGRLPMSLLVSILGH